MRGVILAGGRATRLGPLAAQLNKSLVSVGQMPMLVRQVQQLRSAGATVVDVVTSRGADDQVRGVIERAGLPHTYTTVQPEPVGPGDALRWGLQLIGDDEDILVLMADTVLDDDEIKSLPRNAVAVADAPATRSFCVQSPTGMWLDYLVQASTPNVAVGAFHFSSSQLLEDSIRVAASHSKIAELGMAPVLNEYSRWADLGLYHVDSWQDVGDVPALARATRKRFISRPFHDLEIEVPGTVTKHGDVADQVGAIYSAPRSALHLFPRIFDTTPRSYTMEHIDMPSLAELWLYWPSRPEMWSHVGRELTTQLRELLWPGGHELTDDDMADRAYEMYVTKLEERYLTKSALARNFQAWDYIETMSVNGRQVLSGPLLIDAVTKLMEERFVPSAADNAGWLHGDLNFTNVLWSLRTGSFKLLDPRGSWGGKGSWGDTRYELGKLAYSPEFSAVTHGLATVESRNGWRVKLWPERSDASHALHRELALNPSDLLLLRSYMLLSSAPLHPDPEASALYLLGALAAQQLIDGGGAR